MASESDIELFGKVIERIEEGMPIRKALNGIMPRNRFYDIINESKELQERYARACEARADKMFEEILEIADDSSKDVDIIDIGEGISVEQKNKEVVERTKIRIDARKWMIGKMQPKKYGDKLDVTSDGKEIKQVPPTITIIKPKDA